MLLIYKVFLFCYLFIQSYFSSLNRHSTNIYILLSIPFTLYKLISNAYILFFHFSKPYFDNNS